MNPKEMMNASMSLTPWIKTDFQNFKSDITDTFYSFFRLLKNCKKEGDRVIGLALFVGFLFEIEQLLILIDLKIKLRKEVHAQQSIGILPFERGKCYGKIGQL